MQRFSAFLGFSIALVVVATYNVEAYTVPKISRTPFVTCRSAESAAASMSMEYEELPEPTNFREAEVLGLRLMQEGRFEEALVGMSNFSLRLLWRSTQMQLIRWKISSRSATDFVRRGHILISHAVLFPAKFLNL